MAAKQTSMFHFKALPKLLAVTGFVGNGYKTLAISLKVREPDITKTKALAVAVIIFSCI